ncbi:MAG TPA: hypothetical protein VL326_09010 [Kofleriaceae bacterium]|jgi:hypothetical protein|nr:hypothetical protein [Kofleriaceae bacterium]
MMVADLDEVQYDLELDGELVRKQLARKVWEKRGWATVAIAFTERDKDGEWKSAKLALLRFRREHDAWKKQATITVDGTDALAIAQAIDGWREHLAER